MSVTQVKLVPGGASAEFGAEKFTREYSYTYEVITNSGSDDMDTVQAASDGVTTVPALFSVHPTDTLAFVKRKSVRHVENLSGGRFLWEVVVHYSTDFSFLAAQIAKDGSTPADVNPATYLNPTGRVAAWSSQTQTELEAVETDRNGLPVLNSAGFPFLPPLEKITGQAYLTCTKAKASFALSNLQYVGYVNADAWTPEGQSFTFPAGTVMITGVNTSDKFENNVPFVEVVWNLHYKADGHAREVLDRGYAYLDDSNNVVQFTDAYGQPRSEPTLLDGEGGRLAGTSAVWLVKLSSGTADGGSYTLTFEGDTTESVPWDATAEELQEALEGIESIGAGNVEVTALGGDINDGYDVLFTGELGERPVGGLTGSSSLTGVSPVLSVTEDTPGAYQGDPVYLSFDLQKQVAFTGLVP